MDAGELAEVRHELGSVMNLRRRAGPPVRSIWERNLSGRAHGPPLPLKCAGCGARHAGLCDAISDDDLDQLSAAAVAVTVHAGVRFIEEGAAAGYFFAMTGGTARLFKTLPDARQQITSFAGPGDVLGLAFAARYTTSAEAVDAVRLCRFSRIGLEDLMASCPNLKRRLLTITSNELVLAQDQMLLLGRKQAREKIASFLIVRASLPGDEDGGTPPSGGWPVSLPMRRADIADYLGMTIETVSRTLSRLKAQGLLGISAEHEVVILDVPGLEACAAGS